MTTIELTDEQRRALHAELSKPVDVVDPATQKHYVLIAQEHYERIRGLLGADPPTRQGELPLDVPPGILSSQQAFWRDLPQLLEQKKLRGKWVCYHGDERVGIGTYEDLLRECVRRGLRDDEFDLGVIESHARPPWEPEEIEAGGHIVDEIELSTEPDTEKTV